jgi:putative addiction module killer protein
LLKPGPYNILAYRRRSGGAPFLEWLDTLDGRTQERISGRIDRMRKGNFGDFRVIEQNLYELRFFFGPGYRVYFGEHHGTTILILGAGDKSSQKRDIKEAKRFWQIYQEDNP